MNISNMVTKSADICKKAVLPEKSKLLKVLKFEFLLDTIALVSNR